MFKTLLRENARHGGQNYALTVAGHRVVVVQDLGDIHMALRAADDVFAKDLGWLQLMIGPSRFSENGAAWRVRRDLTEESYRHFDKARLHHRAITLSRALVTAGDQPDLEAALYQLVMDLLLEVQLGLDRQTFQLDAAPFRVVARVASANSFMSDTSLRHANEETRREMLRAFSHARTRAISSLQPLRTLQGDGSALINSLLAAEAAGTIGRFELELLPTLIAGVDSTVAATVMALKVLGLEPAILDILRAEAGDTTARFVDCLLRNLPSTPLLSRICRSATTLPSGLAIAQGDRVILMQLNAKAPTLAQNAALIRAEMVEDGASKRRSFPFGAGARSCSGAQFARTLVAGCVTGFTDVSDPVFTAQASAPLEWRLSLATAGHLSLSPRDFGGQTDTALPAATVLSH